MPELPQTDLQNRYLLMIPLSRTVAVHIEDRFLPNLGATRPAMGYHVSLVGPFYWTGGPDQAALDRLYRACAQAQPLRLAISGVDVFENAPDDCGVFLTVKPARPLQRLHEQLRGALGEAITLQYHRAGPFHPHITIGLNLSSRVCQALRDNTANPIRARFTTSELWLMEQRHQSPWRPLLALTLGSAKAPRALDAERHDG